MNAFADTGFLCSLYAPDVHTQAAVVEIKRQRLPLPIIWLHQLEFRNAMRLRVFRKEITPVQRDASLNAWLADLASDILTLASPSLTTITSEAERLSAQFSATLGTRTLDILHVAAALVLGTPEFLTFDRRQQALAAAAGLKTPILA